MSQLKILFQSLLIVITGVLLIFVLAMFVRELCAIGDKEISAQPKIQGWSCKPLDSETERCEDDMNTCYITRIFQKAAIACVPREGT